MEVTRHSRRWRFGGRIVLRSRLLDAEWLSFLWPEFRRHVVRLNQNTCAGPSSMESVTIVCGTIVFKEDTLVWWRHARSCVHLMGSFLETAYGPGCLGGRLTGAGCRRL